MVQPHLRLTESSWRETSWWFRWVWNKNTESEWKDVCVSLTPPLSSPSLSSSLNSPFSFSAHLCPTVLPSLFLFGRFRPSPLMSAPCLSPSPLRICTWTLVEWQSPTLSGWRIWIMSVTDDSPSNMNETQTTICSVSTNINTTTVCSVKNNNS